MTGCTKEDCPYAPISEDRIECSNVVKSQKRTWKHCNIPKWVAILEHCVLVVLIVLLSVCFAKKSTECVQPDKAANSGNTSLALIMEAENGIDYRISPNTSNCSSTPSCFRCKTEIIPHLEPMHCPNDTRVKNSSCLLCDGKCLELPELIEMKQNDKISHCRQDVTCCTLLIMGIMNNSCEGESYNCYSKDTHDLYKKPEGVPICVCSASNIAGNCTKPFSHQGECKCFKSSGIKLVDQDQMDECDNVSKDWKMCHTYMQEYNCLCERRTGIIDDIQPCQS